MARRFAPKVLNELYYRSKMTSSDNGHLELGRRLAEFCRRYAIPIEHFFDIINDQKVLPMLRGKGMEYNVVLILPHVLNPNEWLIEKLNINPQPGAPDQDIGITHRRTGIRLIAESKSAVRGSMRSGVRSRSRHVPYFTVKCHRSRSNIRLAPTSNDRYPVDAFDVIITNPSNALYVGGTIGEELEVVADQDLLAILYDHYNVRNSQDLMVAALSDWRFVFPIEIGVDGFIPRTPAVSLVDDPHWKVLSELPARLLELVRQRYRQR